MKEEFILQQKTDIGLIRDKNEDSLVTISHPKDNSIKLLAIADGMGFRIWLHPPPLRRFCRCGRSRAVQFGSCRASP